MRNTLLGRLQFLTILAVFALPLVPIPKRTVYASVQSETQENNVSNEPTVQSQILPLALPTLPSLGDTFFKAIEDRRTTSDVDCALQNCLALTFDDGPNQQFTPQVLDILRQYNAYASFFVIGNRVPAHPELVRRTYQEGHDVGNHSWSHPMLNKLTPEQINQEYQVTQQVIAQAGIPAPTMFRPPYGIRTEAALATIPIPFMLWNVDPRDWSEKDVNALVGHILSHSKPGSVIVMHDTSNVTVEALRRVIPELQKNYKLVTLSDMFDLKPGDRGQYFGLQ